MPSDELTKETDKSRWLIYIGGFVLWTIIGLSFASRTYLFYLRQGLEAPFLPILLAYLIEFYAWGLASPFIFRLSRRYLIERGHLAGRILIHLVAGFVFTIAVHIVSTPVFWSTGLNDYTKYPTLADLLWKTIFSPIIVHEGLLTYWITAIAAHSYEYYRRGRDSQMQAARLEAHSAQLATRAAQLSEQLAQAQLSALKMQLHPHFLFNTLNSIASLLHKDAEMAHRMIARLSDFLRMTLKNSETHHVTLEEELVFLNTYLEIEKIRFRDRLMIDVEIEPEALAAKVPNLLLQPIVENAVRHGLANVSSTGHLRISAHRANGKVVIEVEDNGPGYGNEAKPGKTVHQGVGLANTKARLEQFYGGDFDFEITGKKDQSGTVVTIEVPFLN